jgi:excisionase family DNA binding protein
LSVAAIEVEIEIEMAAQTADDISNPKRQGWANASNQARMPMTNDHRPAPLALSPTEAARILGCGRTKLYELLTSGEIKSFHLGRRRLIRLAAIESWIAEREAGQ